MLVVLPTGLGKTAVALLVAAERLSMFPGEGGSHANPLADRIRMIRDEVLKAKELKEIVSMLFLKIACKLADSVN